MGKLALILSAAATMMLTSMIIGVQRSTYETTYITANYEQEVLAREIATSALTAAVSKVRRDYDLARPTHDSTAYQGGRYTAAAGGSPAGPVLVTATGTYDNASYTVQAKLTRLSSLPSSVLVDSDTVETSFVGSDFLISGRDTRPTDGPGAIPEGSGWGTPVGGIWTRTNKVMQAFKDHLNGNLADRVRGLAEEENIINAKIPLDLDQLYNEAVSNADQVFTGDQVFSGQESFGSPSYPAIVVVHGNTTLTGNAEGYGMLVVNGDFETKGNARWNGIVLVSGEGDMYVTHGENSVVFGGVLLRHVRGDDEEESGEEDGGEEEGGQDDGEEDGGEEDGGEEEGGQDDGGQDTGGEEEKVTLCHLPPGNTDNPQTLSIGASAVDAHLAHGDYLGACAEEEPEDNTNDGEVEFDIEGDEVVPQECFNASVTVLGAAISAGGAYDLMVTTEFEIGGDLYAPWGSLNLPVDANVNDGDNPRTYMVPDDYPAGSSIAVTGRSWLKKQSRYSGNKNSHWESYRTIDSNGSSPYVMALRDGDPVPDIQGFLNQQDIMYFVKPYVENGVMSLDPNQVIYLFELGTTNLNSSAADFQDLVVLVTLSEGDGCATSANMAPPRAPALDPGLPPTLDALIASTVPATPAAPSLDDLRPAGLGGLADGYTICHVATNTTMEVSFFGALGHLFHGDSWGPCEEQEDDEAEEEDGDHEDDDGEHEEDDDEEEDDGPNKVTICHVPPGNPHNAHTITVGEPAVEAHLDHGDYLGPCAEQDDDYDGDDDYEEDDDDHGDDDHGDDDHGDEGGDDDGGEEASESSHRRGALHFTMKNQAQIYYSTEAIGKLASRLPSLRSVSWIVSHDEWGGRPAPNN